MSADCIAHMQAVRAEELQRILNKHGSYFFGKDLLELGSGSGFQLEILSSICRSAIGLEVSDSRYRDRGIADIIEYDGKSIPFPDSSFDVIFSSQVLQYLTDERQLYGEMRRVLRPSGVAVHIVPTSVWRFWTSVLHYPAKTQLVVNKLRRAKAGPAGSPQMRQSSDRLRLLLSNVVLLHRLGAKGNWFTEHYLFHSRAWRRRLGQYGWKVERIDPLGMWYSGHEILGKRLSVQSRITLARFLGSPTVAILARPLRDNR